MSRYGRTGMTSRNWVAMNVTLRAGIAFVLNECRFPARCSDLTGRRAGESAELAGHVCLVCVAGDGGHDGEGVRGLEQAERISESTQTCYGLRRQADLAVEPLHE